MSGREGVAPDVHMDDVELSTVLVFGTSLLVAEFVTI
jgi:hypothetical protein